MNSILLHLGLAGLLLATAATAPGQDPSAPVRAEATATASRPIRLGTWNIEHLGKRRPPRTAAQLQDLANYIRDIVKPDVLAVQEIHGVGALQKLADSLGPQWKFLLGSTGELSGGADQLGLGMLWNDSTVEMIAAQELLDLSREVEGLRVFHRVPITAVFRARNGGVDFRVVNCHLKANGYPQPKPQDRAKRRIEALALERVLAEWVADPEEDHDIFLVGDFNHSYDDPAFTALTANGNLRYLKTEGNPTTIVYPQFVGRPIDHVVVPAASNGRALIANSRQVHAALTDEASKDAWKARFSDHAPVTVDLDSRDHDRARFRQVQPEFALAAGGVAAARGSKPAARPTSVEPPKSLSVFQVGVRVCVRYVGVQGSSPSVLNGTLASPLGEWVEIRELQSGDPIAIPREKIVRIDLIR